MFSEAAPGSKPQRRKKATPWPDCGFSQAQAKEYLPPGATIGKEKTWHHRWKVQSKVLGSRSKVFAVGDAASDRAALNYCLCMAWQAWTRASGKACPWQLDELAGNAEPQS